MADNRSTSVTVANHFDGPVTLTLTHRYSDDPPEEKTWERLATGEAGPALTVNYKTGLFTGFDYWKVRVEVLEGRETGVYDNGGWKECYLREADQGTLLTFDVSSAGGFKLNMLSSSCTDGLTKRS